MTVKSHSQRSISDLEQTIKHELLSHENYGTGAWAESNCLLQSEEYLTYGAGNVHSVSVYSDVDHIEQLLRTNSGRAHESIRKSVRRLRRTMKRFNKQFPDITASVHYVGDHDKRNLYYRSAHRIARRMAGIKR